MSAGGESRLVAQLREIDDSLRAAGLRYALIGGVAVNFYGHVRATRDLDILLLADQADSAHECLTQLGYTSIDRREDLASYVRGVERLDMLFARRAVSQRLLADAACAEFEHLKVPIISIEGLIGLKVQAYNDDPRRLRDLSDIIELMKAARGRMDIDEVRSYFLLFDREKLLDDILRSIG